MSGYELGNELQCLSSEQYASSVAELHGIISDTMKEYNLPMPTISASDFSSYDQEFLDGFIPLVQDYLHSITWHSYPLGAGVYCTGQGAENNTSVDSVIMNSSAMDIFFDEVIYIYIYNIFE